eukprot:1159839-Pelagomonas_calceolata.AAC.25
MFWRGAGRLRDGLKIIILKAAGKRSQGEIIIFENVGCMSEENQPGKLRQQQQQQQSKGATRNRGVLAAEAVLGTLRKRRRRG